MTALRLASRRTPLLRSSHLHRTPTTSYSLLYSSSSSSSSPSCLRRNVPRLAQKQQARSLSQADIDDPNMNGGYQNPPREIRQHRDPYADWWDKQERRNFGEPVHEDNDILGMFSPEDYNFYTAPQAFGMLGCAVAVFCGVIYAVGLVYPDRPAVDRGYPGGLDRELGGQGTMIAREKDGLD